jgi:hypothetical protein
MRSLIPNTNLIPLFSNTLVLIPRFPALLHVEARGEEVLEAAGHGEADAVGFRFGACDAALGGRGAVDVLL